MKIFNQNFGVTNILGTCTFCNQKYLKSELEKHMSTHGKKKRHREKNLICEFCGKFFANRSRMEQHKIIHSSDRCYKCDVEGCSKTFKWRNSFEKHKMRHTDNIVKEFKCDLCEKAFMYSYILRVKLYFYQTYCKLTVVQYFRNILLISMNHLKHLSANAAIRLLLERKLS